MKFNLAFAGLVSFITYSLVFNLAASKKIERYPDNDQSMDDLGGFLDDMLSKHKEERLDSCALNFEEESGTILRTRDSLSRGAEYIEAPGHITAEECKKACCNAKSEKTSRICDLAVLQESGYDLDDEQPRCFLFSCTKNGEDVCLTSSNKDYKVLRPKIEKVEEQLLNVATNSSQQEKVNDKAEDENQHGDCFEQFSKEQGSIIKTRESIQNGAKFLEAPKDVSTVENCLTRCCEAKASSHHCDMVVFQETDDDPNDRQARCYLFSCMDKYGVSKCITSSNSDYVVMKRNVDVEEDELLSVAASLSTTVSSTTTTSKSTTTTTMSKPTTTTTTSKPTTTTTTTTKTAIPSASNLKSCARLEWQCDDGSCIKVTDVCDGLSNCADKSDEVDCDGLLKTDLKTQKAEAPSTTSASTTTTSSTTTSHSSTSTLLLASTTKEDITTSVELPVPKLPAHGLEASSNDFGERTEPQKGAVLPLALGLSVTACVLLMVACRMHIMKKKLRRRGKPLSMEESDYLINGMYL